MSVSPAPPVNPRENTEKTPLQQKQNARTKLFVRKTNYQSTVLARSTTANTTTTKPAKLKHERQEKAGRGRSRAGRGRRSGRISSDTYMRFWLYACCGLIAMIVPVMEMVVFGMYFNNYGSCPSYLPWMVFGKFFITVATILSWIAFKFYFRVHVFSHGLYLSDLRYILQSKVVCALIGVPLILLVVWNILSTLLLYTNLFNLSTAADSAVHMPAASCEQSPDTQLLYDFMLFEITSLYAVIMLGLCAIVWLSIDLCIEIVIIPFVFLVSAIAVLAIPVTEVVMLWVYFDHHGLCPISFQYLILSKLILTTLAPVPFLTKKMCAASNGRPFICDCVGAVLIVLLVIWNIYASISLFKLGHASDCESSPNTQSFYDFMLFEVTFVYAIISVNLCALFWFSVDSFVLQATYCTNMLFHCLITFSFTFFSFVILIPVLEIVFLSIYWNNSGECPKAFQYYILSKLVFTIVIQIYKRLRRLCCAPVNDSNSNSNRSEPTPAEQELVANEVNEAPPEEEREQKEQPSQTPQIDNGNDNDNDNNNKNMSVVKMIEDTANVESMALFNSGKKSDIARRRERNNNIKRKNDIAVIVEVDVDAELHLMQMPSNQFIWIDTLYYLAILIWCILASLMFFSQYASQDLGSVASTDLDACNLSARTEWFHDFMLLEIVLGYVMVSVFLCGTGWQMLAFYLGSDHVIQKYSSFANTHTCEWLQKY